MSKGTRLCLLGVVAHPDDETFACGGLLARYAAEGVRVTLICATRGDVGEIADPSLATPETLADVRQQELQNACEVLGVEDLSILGYRDSGMAGTPDNQHPSSLFQAPRREVVGRTVEIIRRTKPLVLVTFDPQGGYGHPDHVVIHQVTREAFGAAGDATMYPEQLNGGLEPHQPSRLYYFVFPRSAAQAFREALIEAGIESDFRDMDPETLGTPDEDITTVVDVAGYADQKERAALCHRTQVQGEEPFAWIPEALRVRFLSYEYLVRAQPPFTPGRDVMEEDLFAGIRV